MRSRHISITSWSMIRGLTQTATIKVCPHTPDRRATHLLVSRDGSVQLVTASVLCALLHSRYPLANARHNSDELRLSSNGNVLPVPCY